MIPGTCVFAFLICDCFIAATNNWENRNKSKKWKKLIKHTMKQEPTSPWTGRRVFRLQSNRPSNRATSSTRGAWPGTTERCLWQGKLGWSRFYWSQKRRLLWSSTHCIIYWATIKKWEFTLCVCEWVPMGPLSSPLLKMGKFIITNLERLREIIRTVSHPLDQLDFCDWLYRLNI